ncbi:hypothetical protein DPMN_054373 [Dreissena polymorpha]|uniref:Uncharacterized protein n=1 Tax=Dreissena polymorpha TaxID=45954 RepID=A0A9D4CNS6_DREPO|nr:hypothetical protein DPMN_054373 [Dreissena polymorpha]
MDDTDWMSTPITDPEEIKKNGNLMRIKMELMTMDIQREFCRALEEEEDGRNFRWINGLKKRVVVVELPAYCKTAACLRKLASISPSSLAA